MSMPSECETGCVEAKGLVSVVQFAQSTLIAQVSDARFRNRLRWSLVFALDEVRKRPVLLGQNNPAIG